MSVRRYAAVLALALCIISAIPMDISDAEISRHADCGNVTMMTFDFNPSVNAGETVSINIYVTNNNSYPVSVEIERTNDSGIGVVLGNGAFTVANNATNTISADLTADKYTAQGDYKIDLKMTVVDNVGKKTETADDGIVIDVSVSSKFSSEGQFNKILGIFENNLPAPFDSIASVAVISAVGWAAIAFAASIASYFLMKFIYRKLKDDEKRDIAKKVSICVLVIVAIYGVTTCLRVIGVDPKTLSSDFALSNMLYAIFGAFMIWYLYRGAVRLLVLRNEDDDDSNDVDVSLVPLFNFVGKIIIVVITVSYILSSLGFNITSVIAGAGIAGLGVSLGAKPAISEFFAGFALLMTHPFRIGETIKVGDTEGLTVVKIGLLKTQLSKSYTEETITILNSTIMSSSITNLSCEKKRYRNVLDVLIPYGTNIQLAKRLLKAAAGEHPNVITDGSVPKPTVMFDAPKETGSITLRLAYYVKDFDVNGSTAGQIREKIVEKFRENGITFPYTVKELTVKEMEGL